jgi:recombination protein RecA
MSRVKKDEDSLNNSEKTIDEILASINKVHGSNTVYKLSEGSIEPVEVISTGSYNLDRALIIGGLPRGRIVEIYGENSTGKSTAALSTIAQAQKNGGKCFYIDAECSFSAELAKGTGVNVDELYICQPNNAEQALEVTNKLVESGKFVLGVIDSVAALVPKSELEGEIGDQTIGLQARIIGQALRMLTGIISKSNTCLIFINQLRSKIGGFSYGPQTDTPGGKALKFYSSVRLEVKRIGSIKEKEEVIGNELKIVVVKNKLAPPFRTAETELIFGKGFNIEGELLDLGLKKGIIEKNGSHLSYKEDKLGNSRTASCEFLRGSKELLEKLKNEVFECM